MALQTFSNTGEDTISQSLTITPTDTPKLGTKDFEIFYEIERTARAIEEGNYKRIALQFPDELLHDSVPIYRALVEKVAPVRQLYVLADTSYGSCCVDEVAASHVDADAMVHYGHACLSQTSRLPVLYVFGRRNIDLDSCVSKLTEYITTHDGCKEAKAISIKHDVVFAHVADVLVERLRESLGPSRSIVYKSLPQITQPSTSNSTRPPRNDVSSEPRSDNCESQVTDLTVWIGDESTTLTKLLLTSGGVNFIGYSPSTDTVTHQNHLTNKLLMRRYAIVQKARDSDVFGILVGTLGVASYLPLITHIRTLLKSAQKKSYTVSVGKINPAKLANFMEIECWVWVACSEGMVDSKDYLRPIITPHELELALQPELVWGGAYVLDFETILANAKEREPQNSDSVEDPRNQSDDEDQPTFSLVTGTYRHAKRYGNGNKQKTISHSSALTRRDANDLALARLEDSAAVQFLHSRSYKGLDPSAGPIEPSLLEEGRSGIASGYDEGT